MPAAQNTEIISFGSFRLNLTERVLTRNSEHVELKGRAYDLLVALLSRPNELISKAELLRQVWPGLVVEEGALRFHMTNLRKALGGGDEGSRYIVTSSGRGYTFVAQVARSVDQEPQATAALSFQQANLPVRLPMIDREVEIEEIPARLKAARFLTIVGAGGVGKTTLAIAVGHRLMQSFDGAILFVDFSMVSDPALVGTVVASLLGLSVQSSDATPSIVAYLRDKRILLILDTCEHLVEPVAAFASSVFATAPNVHILATSREALQADGENVYRLDTLACPPEGADLTAEVAKAFPAIQLFVERARASGAQLQFSDDEAPVVANMCRKLDGVALAIELAARRVESYGVHGTASLLDQRLGLSWLGPRSAPPRQRTLHATLDWSFGLLSDLERMVLRRLATFVGHFTLDAVISVCGRDVSERDIFGAIDSLIAKSMVATRPVGTVMSYRLLDTTRAYARDIQIAEDEAHDLAVRHATYYRNWLEQRGGDWSIFASGAERTLHFASMNNVRAALEWCFGERGDIRLGIRLAAAAVDVFLAMSLLAECHRWSQRALIALDAATVGSSEEMRLQAGLGVSSSQMYGETDAVNDALNRSLAIAEARGDTAYEAGLLNMQYIFHGRSGHFRILLDYAQRCHGLAERSGDLAIRTLAHSALGMALQFSGDLGGSRRELESLMGILSHAQQGSVLLGYDPHYRSIVALARTLWLHGYPDQAADRAREAVKASEAMGHSAALALVLAGAGTVFLWRGDLEAAQHYVDRSYSLAEANAMGPLMAIGRCRKAELTIRRGDVRQGVDDLRAGLKPIHAARHELLTTEFNMELALGLLTLGRAGDGLILVNDAIDRANGSGEMFQMPELLRVKGKLLSATPGASRDEAERCFQQSVNLARAQGARSWELRAATDLAALMADTERRDSAKRLLQDVYGQFSEGFETADLKLAANLLATLA
ncbi:ATP-binding protein [Bradyrhizobium japonicum]|uniref:ATP-binding protein n=2 Tax=Bradyrhizobium japonicum TaxID=375 RepID=UPI00058076AB|nr:winged helix-turn-helix domain-containing protein [Bradyrhizobium japonicum]MCD9108889.1 helix-turn-helix transcriptional regulator [Bradyrhizobium japonicum]MCD9255266.1 helix-turn-helix transcriptional regulator [Bradyrhizobium japonicum SEMIA 5079]MCD9821802.1 helix-turn-helix transcriptional regulator [Bradyrhizobium japonicum]MCD9893819.1 helix-turn-helix transcriptional regulator [Bradyrhizobium japonicum]MCD9908769.1 helix-turn-helix transcriptional regulator [Bradyrhizobium japonicu